MRKPDVQENQQKNSGKICADEVVRMSDKMRPAPFSYLFDKACREYENSGTLFQVPVKENRTDIPVGPAAGPHTQLAQNIAAAYAAGASYFELKTVQVLYGDALGIRKPCIHVANEVYNTEWSSELSPIDAANEYIKAFLLIKALGKALLLPEHSARFVVSVGYDLEGIKSPQVDSFLDFMKDAGDSHEWQKDVEYLRKTGMFSDEDINEICSDTCISDTVTLSTMHGCPSDEIERIVLYLLENKHFNTVVKMNPTLIGKEKTADILKKKGYDSLKYSDEAFDKNISPDDAVSMIKKCEKKAEELGLTFGVKMTNTFPVFSEGVMKDRMMYMSGPALFPLSINAASMLTDRLDGKISISYSGGADEKNIADILASGIQPVTVSSLLLKPGGYSNIGKLITAAEQAGYEAKTSIDTAKLRNLAEASMEDEDDDKKERHIYKRQPNYKDDCAVCHNCVDVCPNRANVRIEDDEGKAHVIHLDRFCNECGCCSFSCLMGHDPYIEKITISDEENVPDKLKKLIKKGTLEGVL